MVRVTPHDSTDQEENQEGVLEEDCHKAFLSLNVLFLRKHRANVRVAHQRVVVSK